MVKKMTKEEFVTRAREVHGDKYSYDKFDYVRSIDKGIIVCPKHGEFMQSANVHLSGHGCPRCASENFTKVGRLTFDVFEERARKVHGGKYTYTRKELRGNQERVEIECHIHGKFTQSASLHLTGQGCPQCASIAKREKMAKGIKAFVEEARSIHGDKYGYDNVVYVNNRSKITLTCPIHGDFVTTPFWHTSCREGCPKCAGRGLTLDDFVEKARKVHGDDYEYTEYVNSSTKIKIKCNKCGNEFYQVPWSHLQGHGCPFCKSSTLEREVRSLIESEGMEKAEQKTFDWLVYTSNMYLDFYLPSIGVAIECQGAQHFPNSRNFGGEDKYDLIYDRDKTKKKLCDEHGIELVYYTHEEVGDGYLGSVFTDVDNLRLYLETKEVGQGIIEEQDGRK